MDELLTWAPKDLLGDFSKVDSSLKLHARLRTISNWYHDGGVLIVGYEMFRNYINNKKPKKGEAPLTQEQHEEIRQALLEGPNIIIADEAHKMKNATAAITLTASQFRSKSRIALTGSPLANNVEEYHTMIDWVAPNYLGPAVEFRAKYVEPIQAGLWGDSSSYERRKSLKMLGVLKEDLAPKVHRADMAVLRNDLPPKKEFVITVPLTNLQRKAYSLYVQSMISGSTERTKSGEVHQTTIWHWLTILSLLCNHPSCFKAKLTERKEDARKEIAASGASTSRDVTDEDEVATAELNAPIWKVGVSQGLINRETKLFSEEASDLNSIELSYKTKILCQIMDASKTAGDKVLVFSQSLPTLDFLERLCENQHRKIARLDGSTQISKRQGLTKAFNKGDTEIYLISTTAGGLGLNLPGANRVVIFDFKFNPIMEEQAVGRAYRIGQKKPVFVYRFVVGGTFEDSVHNKAVFKMQLASRVVDKKNPVAWAKRKLGDFLFEPKDVEQKDLSEFEGMDPKVLDKILASQSQQSTVRAIVQSDTFERDDDDGLTAEEQNEVKQLLSDEQLKRSNPRAWQEKHIKIQYEELARQAKAAVPNRAAFAITAPVPSQQSAPSMSLNNLNADRKTSGSAILPPRRLQNGMNGSQPSSTAKQSATVVSNDISAAPVSASTTHPSADISVAALSPDSPPKSTRDLSPIAGVNTKVRVATRETGVSSSLAKSPHDRHPRSSTPVRGDVMSTPQITTPTASPVKDRSSRSPEEKKKVSSTPMVAPFQELYFAKERSNRAIKAFRMIESALLHAAKRTTETSDSSTDQTWQSTSKIMVDIQKVLGREATDFDEAMDVAASVLKNDYTKCQALLNSNLSPEAFVLGILKSPTSEITSASSDGPKSNGKVGISQNISSS
jgi:superfamily II DNA or RNA helicase